MWIGQSEMNGVPLNQQETITNVLRWAAAQPAWWHDSGNLNLSVLEAIANHAARIQARETAETGCGLSTVVLSVIADCHH